MAMTETEFWALLETTRDIDPETRVEALTEALAELSPEEIIDFGRWWHTARDRAYDNRLWAAAYLMNGGCSDDGFIDFRSWLMLQGRAVYDAALRDPDALADLTAAAEDGGSECECYPAPDAYGRATGEDQAVFYAAQARKYGAVTPAELVGDHFDFDDDAEMQLRFPKLFAKFVGEP